MKINIKKEGDTLIEMLGISQERINELETKFDDAMQNLELDSNIYYEMFTKMNEMDLNLEEFVVLSSYLGHIISRFNLLKDEE